MHHRRGLPIRWTQALSVVAISAVLLATGCQSQSAANREPHAGATTVTAVNGVQNVELVVGNSGFRFTPSTITVHPGKVTITLTYEGSGAPHDWQLSGFPVDYVPLTSAGQTHSTSFIAPAPGTYTFVCTIHVKQGQTGTLIVLPN